MIDADELRAALVTLGHPAPNDAALQVRAAAAAWPCTHNRHLCPSAGTTQRPSQMRRPAVATKDSCLTI